MSETVRDYALVEEYVRGMKFEKIGKGLFVLPGLLLFPASVGLIAELAYFITSSSVPWLVLGALTVMFAGFLVSSAVASYTLLKKASLHFYDSAVVVYYWSRKENFENVLNYLQERREVRSLPSPVTGLLLNLLVGGIGYIAILYYVEKSIREHIRVEEKALFGVWTIEPVGPGDLVRDVFLTAATLGLYLSYWAWRVVSLYNEHVEEIHGQHPNPPSRRGLLGVDHPDLTLNAVLGVVLAVGGLDALLAWLGLYAHVHFAVVLGLALSYTGLKLSDKPIRGLAVSYGLIYLGLAFSTLVGFAGYTTYTNLAKLFESLASEAYKLGFLGILFYIFLNNFSIAMSSTPPLLGPLVVGYGLSNTGVIYGALLASGEATPLLFIMPHTPIELLGYAVFTVASAQLAGGKGSPWKTIAVGSLVLLAAAAVETSLIASRLH